MAGALAGQAGKLASKLLSKFGKTTGRGKNKTKVLDTKAAKQSEEGKKLLKQINKAYGTASPSPKGKGKVPLTQGQRQVLTAAKGYGKETKQIARKQVAEELEDTGKKPRTKIDIDPDTKKPTSKHIAPWDMSNRSVSWASDRTTEEVAEAAKKAGASESSFLTKKGKEEGRKELVKLARKQGISVPKLVEILKKQGLARETADGRIVSTKKYAVSPKSIKEIMGYGKGQSRKGKAPKEGELYEGFQGAVSQRKKAGGLVRRKTGGAIGTGAALRGFGAVRKS